MIPTLALDDVRLQYGAQPALQGVTLQVPAGTLLALVGESGSGKTTLLRTINRMVTPDEGVIRLDAEDVRDVPVVTLRRRIGYVPQQGGLLPHWTILRNTALVPRLAGRVDAEDLARAALSRCGLPPERFGDRLPSELSGGQRQRAALARAIAASQPLMLLDEPFGALDPVSRFDVVESFRQLRAAAGFTAVLVTHDLAEAARVADAIAVMRAGRVEQHGTVAEVLRRPGTPYVASLVERARESAAALQA